MFVFFFFNDTATTEIYTLSLHDALPICGFDGLHRLPGAPAEDDAEPVGAHRLRQEAGEGRIGRADHHGPERERLRDRKSTRLNSSHANISYAVFCLKKKKNIQTLYLKCA